MWRAIGIILLFAATSADAADWRRIGMTPDSRTLYVDLGGLVHSGHVSTFWEKLVALDRAETKQHLHINCAENTWSLQDSIKTNAKGIVTESHSFQPFEQNWMAVPPDTMIEITRDFVCPLQAKASADQNVADKRSMDLEYVDGLIRKGDCLHAKRYAEAGFDPDIVSHVDALCPAK